MLASALLQRLLISIGMFLCAATAATAQAQYYQDDTGYGATHDNYDGSYGSRYRGSSSDVPRPSVVCLYKNSRGECMVEQRFDVLPRYSPTYTRNYQYEECIHAIRNRTDEDEYNCQYFDDDYSFYNHYRDGYYGDSYYGRRHGDPRYDCWAPIDGDEDYKTICNDN